MAEVGVLLHEDMAEKADCGRQCGNMAEMADLECGNMAEEKDTVWIGFMDIVPVIGTVKESVELVLALYEGNNGVIKEKEKALETLISKTQEVVHTQYEPAGDAAEFSGLMNVKEVQKKKIIEHVNKGSKNQNLTSNQQKARAKQVTEIQKHMVKILQMIGEPFNEELKEELTRPKRGAHVFNNDIVKFHSKVVTDFIESNGIYSRPGYNLIQQEIHQLGKHTLLLNTANEIQYKMVVHFDPEEFYVNSNAIVYGAYSKKLREAFLNVLGHINPDDITNEEKQLVTTIIDCMNKNEAYVDQLAKIKWINNNRTRSSRFEGVRSEVANMYREKRNLVWCIDIMHKVAPLFNPGQ